MSTLHKVKAYFGMAPMDDYDDEYYDDEDRSRAAYPPAREERFEDEGYGRYDEPRLRGPDDGREFERRPRGYRGGYPDEPALPRPA